MKNPLAKYKRENGLTVLKLAQKCELVASQIQYLLKMNPRQFGGVSLKTAIRLERNTGISLFEIFKAVVIKDDQAKVAEAVPEQNGTTNSYSQSNSYHILTSLKK